MPSKDKPKSAAQTRAKSATASQPNVEKQRIIFTAENAMSSYLNSEVKLTVDTFNKIPLDPSLTSDTASSKQASTGDSNCAEPQSWTSYFMNRGTSLFVSGVAGLKSIVNYTIDNFFNVEELTNSRKTMVSAYQVKLNETEDEDEKIDIIKSLLVANMKLTSHFLENPKNVSLHLLIMKYDPHSGKLAEALRNALDISKEQAIDLCRAHASQIDQEDVGASLKTIS